MGRTTAIVGLLALSASVAGCYVGLPDGAEMDAGTGGAVDSNADGGPPSGDTKAGDGSGDSANSDSGDDGDAGGNVSTSGPGGETDADEDTGDGDGGDSGIPEAGPLAEGISWDLIEANQGVAITVAQGGALVEVSQRNAALIADRPTLVRGLWTLAPDFQPREIEARIVIQHNGTQEAYSDTLLVSGPPNANSIDGGFVWELPVGALGEGAEAAFELLEVVDDGSPGRADGGARLPASGFSAAGVASGPHDMDVVIVPLRYNAGGGLTPDLSPANRTILERSIYEQNPLTNLSISYRETVDYNSPVQSGNQLGNILGFLSQLKSSDNAGPQVYYAGLVNVGCFVAGCGNAGVAGIAYVTNNSPNSSFQRVSANIWFQPESSSGTVVHEIGHNQGLSHVACPGGGASGTDPSYPYANGQIGRWGWGALGNTVQGSTAHDYMSYCGPSWVSDWTWERTRARVEALSLFDFSPQPPHTTVIVAHAYPDGEHAWFVLHGDRVDDTSGIIRAIGPDGAVSTLRGTEGLLSEDGGRWIAVEVPASAENFETLQWRHDGQVFEVATDQILR